MPKGSLPVRLADHFARHPVRRTMLVALKLLCLLLVVATAVIAGVAAYIEDDGRLGEVAVPIAVLTAFASMISLLLQLVLGDIRSLRTRATGVGLLLAALVLLVVSLVLL